MDCLQMSEDRVTGTQKNILLNKHHVLMCQERICLKNIKTSIIHNYISQYTVMWNITIQLQQLFTAKLGSIRLPSIHYEVYVYLHSAFISAKNHSKYVIREAKHSFIQSNYNNLITSSKSFCSLAKSISNSIQLSSTPKIIANMLSMKLSVPLSKVIMTTSPLCPSLSVR